MNSQISVFDAMGIAIRYIMSNRFQLLHLSVIPFFVSLVFSFIGFVFSENLHGYFVTIVQLPSFIAEGLFVSTVASYYFFTANNVSDNASDVFNKFLRASNRQVARNVFAASVLYALSAFIVAGIIITLGNFIPELQLKNSEETGIASLSNPQENIIIDSSATSNSGGQGAFKTMLVIIFPVFFIICYKYLWLCIPVAIGISVKNSILLFKGFRFSIFVFSIGIICFLVSGMIYWNIAMPLFKGSDGDLSLVHIAFISLIEKILHFAVLSVITCSLSVAIRKKIYV